MDHEHRMRYHTMSVSSIFEALQTQKEGLSKEEAEARYQKFGPNSIENKEHFNYFLAIFESLKNPFALILIVAICLSFFSGHAIDGFVILFVLLINIGIEIYHQKSAHGDIELLRKGVSHASTVLRNGLLQKKPSELLVPGDIVVLQEGTLVPADGRIFEMTHLRINESVLTGESEAVQKDTRVIHGTVPISDMHNMAWFGTEVMEGEGMMVVTKTGFGTQFGSLKRELESTKRGSNPFLERIKKLSKTIGIAGCIIALSIFGIQYGILEQNLGDIIIFSLAMLVSIIPESLPTVINITLARGARHLAEEHAVVKELSTIESIGGTTVLITDKTGTLTENVMRVEHIMTRNDALYEVTGFGWKPVGMFLQNGKRVDPNEDADLSLLLDFVLLGNRSHVYQEQEKDVVIGEPTEAALLVASQKAGKNRTELLGAYNIVMRTRFIHAQKILITVLEKDKQKILVATGAPETIWKYSSVSSLSQTTTEEYAKKGLRTIATAFAYIQDIPEDWSNLPPLSYLGFVAMRDPIRSGVKETIQEAKNSGIRIIMATGDHKRTASSIALELGIIKHEHEVMDGSEFLLLDEKTQKEKLKTINVFARVTPEVKLLITKMLQKNKEVVTMVGDGVNDTLALKQADVGVAMGNSGTDAARSASSIVLTNDNFITIVHAIFRGRHVYKNIKYVTNFLLSTNGSEALVLIIVTFLGMPLPLIATQILLINLVTDGIGALPFAFSKPKAVQIERGTPGTLLSRFDYGLIGTATVGMAVGTLIAFSMFVEYSVSYAQSMAFLTLSLTQIGRLLVFARGGNTIREMLRENPWFVRSVGISLSILVLIFGIPGLRNVFHLEIISLSHIGLALLLSLTPVIFVGLYKTIIKQVQLRYV